MEIRDCVSLVQSITHFVTACFSLNLLYFSPSDRPRVSRASSKPRGSGTRAAWGLLLFVPGCGWGRTLVCYGLRMTAENQMDSEGHEKVSCPSELDLVQSNRRVSKVCAFTRARVCVFMHVDVCVVRCAVCMVCISQGWSEAFTSDTKNLSHQVKNLLMRCF